MNAPARRPRVAVIGSGIAGLGASHRLAPHCDLTLFEAGDYFGGHTHTVDVTVDGITHGVDTGFLVFNERTYPKLIALFAELEVATARSDMSFSVQLPATGLEWNGATLDTVFAQRRNLVSPRFWAMLRDLLRFNRLATELAEQGADAALRQPIADFLDAHRFGAPFREAYLLPMVGCIWSCPTDQMLRFPIGTLIRFCHNHGLIQVNGRPGWWTVQGGARHYVERIVARLADARLKQPVRRIRRVPPGSGQVGVWVDTDTGSERFDEVVLACHSDQALALLAEPSADERSVLGAIRYHPNEAVLHTDAAVMPKRRRAWAAWNYERAASAGREETAVCLHYWLNRLQPLPFRTPVLVSLNPARPIDPAHVIDRFEYAHPVFDLAAVDAQKRLPDLQGRARTWFCGAWTRYGFHEDGLMSGLAVAEALQARWAAAAASAPDAAATEGVAA